MKKRNIQFILDTNILIDLNKYLKSPTQYAMVINPKHFCEIKAFAKLLENDLNKGRDRELFFSVPQKVLDELMDGYVKYDGDVFKMIRIFDIDTTAEMEKDGKMFRLLYSLLQGRNRFFEQFTENLFDDEKDDCKIVVTAVMENKPVLTSNIKHFAGENNCIQNQIFERLDACSKSSYVQNNFDLKYDKYGAYSISTFLEEYFPDRYEELVEDIKHMKNKGGLGD